MCNYAHGLLPKGVTVLHCKATQEEWMAKGETVINQLGLTDCLTEEQRKPLSVAMGLVDDPVVMA